MPVCAILKCKNTSALHNLARGGVSYHRFPHDPCVKEKWISATGRPIWWKPSKVATICSQHFAQKDLVTKDGGRHYLRRSAVPTLNIPSASTTRYHNIAPAPGVDSSQDSVPSQETISFSSVLPEQLTIPLHNRTLLPQNTVFYRHQVPPQDNVHFRNEYPRQSIIPSHDARFSQRFFFRHVAPSRPTVPFPNEAPPEKSALKTLLMTTPENSNRITSIEIEIMPENEIILRPQNDTSPLGPQVLEDNDQTNREDDKTTIEMMRVKIKEQDLLIRKLKLRNCRLKKRLFSLKSMESSEF